ncbi:RsfA family transcriptional regulator [Metabacillus niabensis]|uniref:Vacuolar-type H+-ATPase subunit I/STV1 n=1 Tax=Metabacillus niabensis TaxID=324854 RepID=A0ABT9Z469_9BACI|nr:RsfA family transcriptional regulator [Metabacillus niabensis]MDQ0227064.1 vacuolar-type H+-ATPase subunit I/STV1 [Metabacillus niabensis]PAD70078.1 RsfA family transcriptional regulator [Bacillus sp. 7586-K]
MTTTRQDAWTQDEDLLLAEIVLRHIREGATQLAAFEEVGRRLSRTAAACGFRWNSHVRKQYKTGIELAKKQRKELRTLPQEQETENQIVNEAKEEQEKPSASSKNTIKELISFLQQYEEAPSIQELQKENKRLKDKVQQLEASVNSLEQEKEGLIKNLQVMEEDYHALIEIMDRARKMVILQEDERNRKVKFQMDKNGNLERVEK